MTKLDTDINKASLSLGSLKQEYWKRQAKAIETMQEKLMDMPLDSKAEQLVRDYLIDDILDDELERCNQNYEAYKAKPKR